MANKLTSREKEALSHTIPSRTNTYIVTTIIGFVEWDADTEHQAWAEVMSEEIGLSDVVAMDKEALSVYLRNKGFKTIRPSKQYSNVYEVKK